MIHEAGALMTDGVQRCTRCDHILNDYRNTMVPEGTPPMRGWAVGAFVEVLEGNPTYSGVTDQAPNCEPLTAFV